MTIQSVIDETSKVVGASTLLLILGLIGVNAGLSLYFWGRKKFVFNDVQKSALSKLRNIYPQLNQMQIRQLLSDTWSLPMRFDSFTHFAEQRPYKTKHVNVSPFGFRKSGSSSPWPLHSKKFNVFFVGGSTTFGYGVQDSETIPAYFQGYATNSRKNKVTTYNFGRGFYFSTQERILVQKLLSEGIFPDLVVCLDGINDFLLVDGEPADLRSMKAFFNGTLDWRRLLCEFKILRRLPIIKYLQQRNNIRSDQSQQRHSASLFQKDKLRIIKKTANRYLYNLKIMDCISDQFGFKNLFVFQPSPYFKAHPQSHYFYKPKIGSLAFGSQYQKMGYAYMENRKREIEAKHNFLWLADMQKPLSRNLYCDAIHYSPEFNRIIAKKIFGFCEDHNLFKKESSNRRN